MRTWVFSWFAGVEELSRTGFLGTNGSLKRGFERAIAGVNSKSLPAKHGQRLIEAEKLSSREVFRNLKV